MSLPCDFLRKGSGGMAMQVSLTQFTTFPLQLKVPNCYGRPSFPFRNRTEGRLSCTVQSHTTVTALMGCENPKVRTKTLQKGKETKSMFNNKIRIMHAKVFQITLQRVDEDNILNEDTLTQGETGSFYDWCQEISKEDRKKVVRSLVENTLPKGMFSLVSDDEMVYNGGSEEWKKEWVADVQKKAAEISTENIMQGGMWVRLSNPLTEALILFLGDTEADSFSQMLFCFYNHKKLKWTE